MFMKMPIRGFNNASFRTEYLGVNLSQINAMYKDGETVNVTTLAEKGYLKGRGVLIKILGNGELKKNVQIEADAYSASAQEKLHKAKIQFRTTEKS